MSRKAKPIVCSKSDILQLQSLMEDTSSKRIAKRARMVLMCIDGMQVKDIAIELHERPNTVIFWRNRFVNEGISSLRNLPRGCQKIKYGDPFKQKLLQKLDDPPPDGHKRWTGSLLSAELGESTDTIWRYLRIAGIKLTENKTDNQILPFEHTIELLLELTLKKENIMAKEKTHEKSDIKLTATITNDDGTVIEKTITFEKSIPHIDDFDFGTRAGFLEDLNTFENSMRDARDQLMTEIAQSYMNSSKKKKEKK